MRDDSISRQAAIDAVCHQYCASSDETETALGDAIDEIRSLPSAERRGRWIDIPFTARWICSNCDYISEFASFKYCPDCGSRMDLEDEEE